jgi:hypothetical protein
MTREDIVHMVREAGGADITSHGWTSWVGTQSTEFLERFADLVAAEKEKQIINILRRLQERNHSHNYYAYAINVIKGEA